MCSRAARQQRVVGLAFESEDSILLAIEAIKRQRLYKWRSLVATANRLASSSVFAEAGWRVCESRLRQSCKHWHGRIWAGGLETRVYARIPARLEAWVKGRLLASPCLPSQTDASRSARCFAKAANHMERLRQSKARFRKFRTTQRLAVLKVAAL